MKIEIDTHTHTILSGHAHSTILEYAQYARKAGLKGLVITEHGHAMPASAPEFNIMTYYMIPQKICGVRIYRGIEANITSLAGGIDTTEKYLQQLDLVIASLHEAILKPGTREENTEALVRALNNPYVDVIGHPGNPYFEADPQALVLEAKRLDKLLELNNHSFTARKGSLANCTRILKLCKENSVRITVSSDAHICFAAGKFDRALEVIAETGFPGELIVNRTIRSFEAYLAERKKRLSQNNEKPL